MTAIEVTTQHTPATLGALVTNALNATGLPMDALNVTTNTHQSGGSSISIQCRRAGEVLIGREEAHALGSALGIEVLTPRDSSTNPDNTWLAGATPDGIEITIHYAAVTE